MGYSIKKNEADLVELADSSLLGLVDDGQGAGDGLANISDAAKLGWGTGAADLGNTKVVQLLFEVVELLGKLVLGLAAEF